MVAGEFCAALGPITSDLQAPIAAPRGRHRRSRARLLLLPVSAGRLPETGALPTVGASLISNIMVPFYS